MAYAYGGSWFPSLPKSSGSSGSSYSSGPSRPSYDNDVLATQVYRQPARAAVAGPPARPTYANNQYMQQVYRAPAKRYVAGPPAPRYYAQQPAVRYVQLPARPAPVRYVQLPARPTYANNQYMQQVYEAPAPPPPPPRVQAPTFAPSTVYQPAQASPMRQVNPPDVTFYAGDNRAKVFGAQPEPAQLPEVRSTRRVTPPQALPLVTPQGTFAAVLPTAARVLPAVARTARDYINTLTPANSVRDWAQQYGPKIPAALYQGLRVGDFYAEQAKVNNPTLAETERLTRELGAPPRQGLVTPDIGGALQAIGQLGRGVATGQITPRTLGDIATVVKDAPSPAGALALWEAGPGNLLSTLGRNKTFKDWVWNPAAIQYQGHEPTSLAGELGRASQAGLLGALFYGVNRASDVAFMPTLAAGTQTIVQSDPEQLKTQQLDLHRQALTGKGPNGEPLSLAERRAAFIASSDFGSERQRVQTLNFIDNWTTRFPEEKTLQNVWRASRLTIPEYNAWQRTTPLPLQLGVFFIDPLNWIDNFAGGFVGDAGKLARLKQLSRPAEIIENGVKRSIVGDLPAIEAGIRAGTHIVDTTADKLAKVPLLGIPWKPTVGMNMTRLVDESADFLGVFNQVAGEDKGRLLTKWIINPLDPEVQAKLGPELSRSVYSAQSWALVRKVIGEPDPATTAAAARKAANAEQNVARAQATFTRISAEAGARIQQADAGAVARTAKAAQAIQQAEAQVADTARRLEAAQLMGSEIKAAKLRDQLSMAENRLTDLQTRAALPGVDMAARERQAISKAQAVLEEAEAAAIQARQAATATQAGGMDFAKLREIVQGAGDDKTLAVERLAEHYEEAARAFFGTPKQVVENGVKRTVYELPKEGGAKKVRSAVAEFQGTFFLGYNPGYALRNASNNLITALVDGVNPFTPADVMQDFFARWDYMPVATMKGFSSAGNIAKGSARATELQRSAQKALGARDILKLWREQSSWKEGPTRSLAQLMESYASQRITHRNLEHFWAKVWPATIKDFRTALRADPGPLTPEQIEFYVRRLRGAMSPAEVRAIGKEMGYASDLSMTVPDHVAQIMAEAGGEAAVKRGEEVARMSPAAQEAVVAVTEVKAQVAAEVAAASARIDELAQNSPPAGAAQEVVNWLHEIDQAADAVNLAHDARLTAVWEAANEVTNPAERRLIWEDYRQQSRPLYDQLSQTVADLEDTTGRALGMSQAAIDAGRAFREATAAYWRTNDALLRNFFDQVDTKQLSWAMRDDLWQQTKLARRKALEGWRTRRDAFLLNRADETFVMARGDEAAIMPTVKRPHQPAVPPPAVPVAPTRPPAQTVQDFVARMMRGENMQAPADLEFYQNNAAAIEEDLRKSAAAPPPAVPVAPTRPPAPAPAGAAPRPPAPPAPSSQQARMAAIWQQMAQYKGKTLSALSVKEKARTINAALREAGLAPISGDLQSFMYRLDQAQYQAIMDYTAADRNARHAAQAAAKQAEATAQRERRLADAAAERARKADEKAAATQEKAAKHRAEAEAEHARQQAERAERQAAKAEQKAEAATKQVEAMPEPVAPRAAAPEPDEAADLADYAIELPTVEPPPRPVLVAKPSVALPPLPPEVVPANTSAAYGQFTRARTADFATRYDMHYKVMSLDDLITSNLDDLQPNPAYPEALQPRDRSRFGSREQIDKIIARFDPDGLLMDAGVLDEGPMIVGADNFVESGNGRILALRTMRRENPDLYLSYQQRLPAYLERYGIDPGELVGISDAVLVRESIDIPDRVRFVQEANQDSGLRMSPAEVARGDARRITLEAIEQLVIGDEQSIDDALLAAVNGDFLRSFLAGIAGNERAGLLNADGRINSAGLNRIKSALLTRAYPGEAGSILAESMLEAVDEGTKNLQASIYASLPRVSRTKALIDAGQIGAELDITDDVAYVANVLARLRQSGKTVAEFLAEVEGDGRLFAQGDMTALQADMLRLFDRYRRSYKPLRDFLNTWADESSARLLPSPEQIGFDLGEPVARPATTLEEVYGRAKAAAAGEAPPPVERAPGPPAAPTVAAADEELAAAAPPAAAAVEPEAPAALTPEAYQKARQQFGLMTRAQFEAAIAPITDGVKSGVSWGDLDALQQEFVRRYGAYPDNLRHEVAVAHALERGAAVPLDVLKDYPPSYWEQTFDLRKFADDPQVLAAHTPEQAAPPIAPAAMPEIRPQAQAEPPVAAPVVAAPVAPPPAATGSFMAEFDTGEGQGYSSNLLRFATREEADQYGRDLMFRWTQVRDYRVAESTDSVKHAWGSEGLVYLADVKKAPPVAFVIPERFEIPAGTSVLYSNGDYFATPNSWGDGQRIAIFHRKQSGIAAIDSFKTLDDAIADIEARAAGDFLETTVFPAQTRETIRIALARIYGDEDAARIADITEARARVWADFTNAKSDEWYGKFLAGVERLNTDTLSANKLLHNPQLVSGVARRLDDSRFVIGILRKGDATTIIHELGHVFLGDMGEAAKVSSEAADQLRVVNTWAEGVLKTNPEFGTVDEVFAYGFQKYVATGKAPTSALHKAFEWFQEWLRKIVYSYAKPLKRETQDLFDMVLTGKRTAPQVAAPPAGVLTTPVKVPKAPAEPPPVRPPAPAKTRTVIGKNSDGLDIWEDQHGVRHISRNGIDISEPVQMIPTRSGIEWHVTHDDKMHPEFAPVDQAQIVNPPTRQPLPQIGSDQRVMNTDTIVTAAERIDDVDYVLYASLNDADNRVFIRSSDAETGEMITLRDFPANTGIDEYWRTINVLKQPADAPFPPTPRPGDAPILDAGRAALRDRTTILFQALADSIENGTMPTSGLKLYDLAEQVLPGFNRRSEADIDLLFDTVEAVVGQRWASRRALLGPDATVLQRMALADAFEGQLPRRARSVEITELQQFSTPYPLAEALDTAAMVTKADIVLEPNGGTGGLVMGLKGQAGKIIVNELDDRRLAVLDATGMFDEVRKGDALRLAVDGVKANVVVMNSPWGKYTTGRYGKPIAGTFEPGDVAERFVAQALNTLPEGGRLVALMPTTMMGVKSTPFRNWLAHNHTIRAIIQAPPNAYLKRGTGVDSLILVLDKGQWPNPNQIIRIVGTAQQPRDLAELAQYVSEIAPRPVGAAAIPQELVDHVRPPQSPRTAGGTGPRQPQPPAGPRPDAGVRTGGRGAAGRAGDTDVVPAGRPGDREAPVTPRAPGVGADDLQRDVSGTPSQPKPTGEGLAPVRGESDADIRARFERERAEQEAEARQSKHFTPYQVRSGERISPHPRALVETQTLAGAPYPALTYDPHPHVKAALRAGDISDEQYDVIRATGQAFANRHGILVADDVGVGKSREIAGTLVDLFGKRQSTRALVTTRSDANITDLIDQIKLVAGPEAGNIRFVRVTDYKDVKKGEMLPRFNEPTVYLVDSYNFAAYREGLKHVGFDTWLADEAHIFKNIEGDTQIGKAWRDLHVALLGQQAKIAYYTATPATIPEDLEYLYALKEWTTADGGFDKFLRRITGTDTGVAPNLDAATGARVAASDSEDVASGGKSSWGAGKRDVFSGRFSLPEMEQLMREMKRKGKYISRDLWRGGVEFEVKEIGFDAAKRRELEQAIAIARDIDIAWRKFAKLNAQMKSYGPRGMLQNEIKRRFFDARLDQIMDDAEAAVKRGEQVVIYTTAVNPVEVGGGNMNGAVNAINTWAVKKLPDGSLTDPAEIPEALVAIMEFRERLNAMPPLRDPIKTIQERLGPKNVGMVTGKDTQAQRQAMMNDFQNGKRGTIVISDAGIIGINLHHVKPGTGRRNLLVAEYQWAADAFKQLLGRVDRSGQLSSPVIKLYHTGAAAERKFISTIANRLQSLGALSKGQAGGGSTANLEAFEVFGRMGRAAMAETWELLDREQRHWFLASAFRNPNMPQFAAEHLGEGAQVKQFFIELQLMPLDVAKQIETVFVKQYDEISDAVAVADQVKTARITGEVLRSTKINDELVMHEVKNAAGQHMGILEGVLQLSPPGQPTRIAPIMEALRSGTDPHTSRHYMNFRDTASGKYISGLTIPPSRVEDVARALGATIKRSERRLENLLEDLHAGDKITLVGPQSESIALRQRRDGFIVVDGARIGLRSELMAAGAKFSPSGQFFYLDEPDVVRFVQTFPLAVDPRPLGADVARQPGLFANVVNPISWVRRNVGDRPFNPLDSAAATWNHALAGLRGLAAGSQPRAVPALTPEQAAWLRKFTDDKVIPSMARDKMYVNRAATDMRNFALGDYTHKRNYHDWLMWLYPYAYWYTFTYPNWAKRLALHPMLGVNYMRYKRALAQHNEEYYREKTGDPNAVLPDYNKSSLFFSLPFSDTEFQVNIEDSLNPLKGVVGMDFEPRERTAAPGGALYNTLNNFGPTIWSPYSWIYAAWLYFAQNNPDAAAQIWGYTIPQERIVKGLTAAAREYIPGADKVIPPGGWTPSMLLPWNERGDFWDVRQIPRELVALYEEGKFSQQEIEEAAYTWDNAGAWGEAAQRQAIRRLWPNLASFFMGQGYKPRDIRDIEIESMWQATGRLQAQRDALTPDEWRQGWADLDRKYPWRSVFLMARERDPIARLADYSWIVLNRLPPSTAGYTAKEDAGLPAELVDKFFQVKSDLSKFTPEELATWQKGIEALAGDVPPPSPERLAQYEAAKAARSAAQQGAVGDQAVRQGLGDIDVAGAGQYGDIVGLAWLKQKEQQYYAIPEEDKAARDDFLTQYPELKRWWNDAKDAMHGTAAAEFYLKPKDDFYYYLPPGSRWRAAVDIPVDIQALLDKAYSGTATDDEYTAVAAWLKQNLPAEWQDRKAFTTARQLNEQFEAAALKAFGADILDWNKAYGAAGDKAAKVAWKAAHPKEYAALLKFWNFKRAFGPLNPDWEKFYGFADSGSSGRSYGSYTRRSYGSRGYTRRYYTRRYYTRRSYRKYYAKRRYYSKKRYYKKRYYTKRRYYSKRYYARRGSGWVNYARGGGGGYGGGGGGAGGTGTFVSPPAPVTSAPPWQAMKLTDFNTALAALRTKNPQLDAVIGKLFGADVLSDLLAYLVLSDADRKLWLADPNNRDLSSAISSFFAWFAELNAKGSGQDARILGSIPGATPTPPGLPKFVLPTTPPPTPPVPPAVGVNTSA